MATPTKATKAPAYTAASIAGTGIQIRYRGATTSAYLAPLGALRAWAGAHPHHNALVGTLTHHGWAKGGTVPATKANPKLHARLTSALQAKALPANCYAVGSATAPQMVAAFTALAKAGAPAAHLAAVWACYTGPATPK